MTEDTDLSATATGRATQRLREAAATLIELWFDRLVDQRDQRLQRAFLDLRDAVATEPAESELRAMWGDR